MKNAIWSRRNFITVSSLAVIAAAVPVAAAKAASKAIGGRITGIIIGGHRYAVRSAGALIDEGPMYDCGDGTLTAKVDLTKVDRDA